MADLTPKEEQEYLDSGWVDAEEFVSLVEEIIISRSDKDSDFEAPLERDDGSWYLSREHLIQRIIELHEQRDHLVALVAMLFREREQEGYYGETWNGDM